MEPVRAAAVLVIPAPCSDVSAAPSPRFEQPAIAKPTSYLDAVVAKRCSSFWSIALS